MFGGRERPALLELPGARLVARGGLCALTQWRSVSKVRKTDVVRRWDLLTDRIIGATIYLRKIVSYAARWLNPAF